MWTNVAHDLGHFIVIFRCAAKLEMERNELFSSRTQESWVFCLLFSISRGMETCKMYDLAYVPFAASLNLLPPPKPHITFVIWFALFLLQLISSLILDVLWRVWRWNESLLLHWEVRGEEFEHNHVSLSNCFIFYFLFSLFLLHSFIPRFIWLLLTKRLLITFNELSMY